MSDDMQQCAGTCNLCDMRPCAEPAGPEPHPHVCAECRADMVPGRVCSFCGAVTPADAILFSAHKPDCRKPGNVRLSDIQRAARMTGH